MFLQGSLCFSLILCICWLIPLRSEAKIDSCTGYKCLKKLEGEEVNDLDEVCRNNQIGLDRFCYCCGGVTNYHIYGNICNRYCLKLFDRESISFSKPCRLTAAKRREIKQRNDKKLNPFDEDGNFNYDEPFPNTPQKMSSEFIECASSDGDPITYADFTAPISPLNPNIQLRSSAGVDILLERAPKVFTKSIHDFTQGILTQIMRKERGTQKNFVFSPFSLHVTLSMLTAASTDNSITQSELLNALGRTRNIEELSRNYQDILEEYEENDNLLSFGNGVWTKKTFYDKLEHGFLDTLDRNYLADVKFFRSNPTKQINEWVSRKTKGKIDKLVDDVPEQVELLLTNALYFKDSWTKPFEMIPSHIERKFTLNNGTQVDVSSKMMYRDSTDFLLISNLTLDSMDARFKFTVLSIPYSSLDSRFEMIILMPEHRQGLAILEDFLYDGFLDTTKNYENVFDQITHNVELARKRRRHSISVELPMFTIKSEISVVEHMTKMGVKAAFDTGEFDKLTKKSKMRVSGIKHKAVIEVTKEGTTGVAATGVEIGVLSANFFQKIANINKPFLFFVRDRRSENLLFVGNVNNPLSE